MRVFHSIVRRVPTLVGLLLGASVGIPLALASISAPGATEPVPYDDCTCRFDPGSGEFVGDFSSECEPTTFMVTMDLEAPQDGTCDLPPCIDTKCSATGWLSVEMEPAWCPITIYRNTDVVVIGLGAVAIPVAEALGCGDFTDWLVEVGSERIVRVTNWCRNCQI